MADLNVNPGQNPIITETGKEVKGTSETTLLPHRAAKYNTITNTHVKIYVWELPVRVWHWINFIAIFALMITGIYIGKPFASASIAEDAYYSYLMGWARYIHFFCAFIFTANMIFRQYWVFKGNRYAISHPFRKIFWVETWETIKFYLFMRHKKPHFIGHNPLAQLSYIIFMGLGSVFIIFTGFFLYFEPQPESVYGNMFFSWVPFVFGGDSYTVRSWHHLVAWAFMGFTVIHIYLAFREDYLQRNGTMSSIFTGYKMEPKKYVGEKDEK
ncbi:Ni/Fe-hydrogenase, b-type cytochrome subunit [Bacillus massilinigeriensis]|uniref:Ni/Fe-hydrogenase, b-type cytochrome subunit n=1 Tax=Bacillus mediterraneensis TaxID=1805474 RepID=UPI0008F86286|nr:Ni/Fe-hydrogenase, b-type cytochrome subunit [Bacillus mediterraneensis]